MVVGSAAPVAAQTVTAGPVTVTAPAPVPVPPVTTPTTVAPPVTVAVAGLLPGAVQFGWPALLSIVSDLAPRARATALALNNSAYYLGGALGPPLVGLAVGHLGIGGLGLPGVLVIGLALLLAAGGPRGSDSG